MIPTNLNWTICNETGSQRLFQKSNWTHLATSVPGTSIYIVFQWELRVVVQGPGNLGMCQVARHDWRFETWVTWVPTLVVRRSATVRIRLWIPRCIAHTTQTKRYIAARRGEKADGAVTKMGREDVGYSMIQPFCSFSKCEQMTSTASDILTLREIRRVFWRSVMRDYLGWNYWRCLLAFGYLYKTTPATRMFRA